MMKRYLAVALVALLMGAAGGGAATVGVLAYTHQGGSAYFTDCSASSPHDQDIGWATEYGVVNGYWDGTYHPGAAVTREQMTSYIMRSSAADPLVAVLLVDYAYFGGEIYGEAAYNEGRISYEDWVMFSDLWDWYMAMANFEASRSGAKSPVALAAVARTMEEYQGRD